MSHFSSFLITQLFHLKTRSLAFCVRCNWAWEQGHKYVLGHKYLTSKIFYNSIQIFKVLLTVHHAMILGNCPTWRGTNSFQYIYLFIVIYMFRACHTHHQEKQTVSIQLMVIVTPCWWQCRVLVGGKLGSITLRHTGNILLMNFTCNDSW